MDQNVIRLTKLFYKKSLLSHIVSHPNSDVEQALKSLNIKHAVTFLVNAWNKVDAKAIERCWKGILEISPDDYDPEDDLPLTEIRCSIIAEHELQMPIQHLLEQILLSIVKKIGTRLITNK